MNTIARLRYHAGLEEQEAVDIPSLAEVLWRRESFEKSIDDVFRVLQILNLEMNGTLPSRTIDGEQCFPRKLIYAITEIIALLRKTAGKSQGDLTRNELNKAAWRVETAWSAILAGDIDDLLAHVAEEEAAA